MSLADTHDGWETRTVGPVDAARTVLLLPGALCSAEFYEDVMEEPALAGVRLVAVTVPGWAGTKPLSDLSMETYARAVARVAADFKADVMVGHSMGANYALEAAALGVFSGPVVLLSPSFCRKDEATFLGVLNAIGKVPLLGAATWWAAMKGMPGMIKKTLPGARAEVLAAELAKNDPSFCRKSTRPYFEYLDRYGSVAPRLGESGVKAWVVFGSNDEIELQDDERIGLEASPNVTMATVEGTHMFLVEEPTGTAEVIAEAVKAVG